jgi:hypothetical protein
MVWFIFFYKGLASFLKSPKSELKQIIWKFISSNTEFIKNQSKLIQLQCATLIVISMVALYLNVTSEYKNGLMTHITISWPGYPPTFVHFRVFSTFISENHDQYICENHGQHIISFFHLFSFFFLIHVRITTNLLFYYIWKNQFNIFFRLHEKNKWKKIKN